MLKIGNILSKCFCFVCVVMNVIRSVGDHVAVSVTRTK